MIFRKLNTFNLIITIGIFNFTYSQDFHYSMFEMSPLNMNPALTGWYNADARITAHQRTQWSSVSKPFNTMSLSLDSKNKKFPIGLQINQDNAGDSYFKTQQLNLSSALSFISDSLQNLRFGIQMGVTNRSLDITPLSFDAQYNGFSYDATLPIMETLNTNSQLYPNINIGFLYTRIINTNNQLNATISLHNLNRSNQSFFGDKTPLDMKFLSRLEYKIQLQKFISLKTTLLILKQGPHNEVVAGIEGNYTATSFMDINRSFWAGLFYRNKDAMFLTAGIIHDQWKAGLSYDINLSKLIPASRYRGGFEIGLVYFIKRKLNLENPLLICPDYL
jgi:type IX secretion system PorP/SprF family membrane protein